MPRLPTMNSAVEEGFLCRESRKPPTRCVRSRLFAILAAAHLAPDKLARPSTFRPASMRSRRAPPLWLGRLGRRYCSLTFDSFELQHDPQRRRDFGHVLLSLSGPPDQPARNARSIRMRS